MSDVANLDEAKKCLEIASAALQAGNLDKAARFAEKAMKLHPHDEARKLMRIIRSRQGGSSSASGATPNGTGTAGNAGPDLRRRNAASSSGASRQEPAKEDRSTPEQRELVASILRKKDFYEILSLQKSCTEDDIKRSYKKLALKLHPDKNTAPRSDEAFKAVSKAFSCLSDADKRAAYDRYGEEPSGGRATNAGPFRAGQGFDDFDPNEIFNMFFGGGFGGFQTQRNANVFRTFGGFPGPQQRQQQGEPPALGLQLLHLLPIIAMLLFSFYAFQPAEQVFSLDRVGEFQRELLSSRFSVPYYVKGSSDFERNYPKGSRARLQLEHSAEIGYKERLDRLCYNERLHQQRLNRWNQVGKAQDLPMQACKEIVEKFGSQYSPHHTSIYGF